MFQIDILWRIKNFLSKDRKFYSSLFYILGFPPHHLHYYKIAMLHRSRSVHDATEHRILNNERLEFLGDAVLDSVVGDIVFRRFPEEREGFLTQTRSKLVKRATLNKVAGDMGLMKLVRSNTNNTLHNSYMGGNAFEALVGAIYLDRGYEFCMCFFEKKILSKYIDIEKISFEEVNFKSELIEWGQKNKIRVDFLLVNQTKDNQHSPLFQSKVVIEDEISGGIGKGYSKRESQQKAAERTLQRLSNDTRFRNHIFQTHKNNRMKTIPRTGRENTSQKNGGKATAE